mgnify:CR=1 FL=1
MGKLMKQKTFILALICFATAVIIAVIMSIWNRPEEVILKLGSALEQGDAQKYSECYQEENRDAANMEFTLTNTFLSSGTIHFLYGETAEADDGIKKESVVILYNQNGYCQDMSTEEYNIVTVDGKQYIAN